MIGKQPRSFPIDWVRGQFPALRRRAGNQPVIFLDGPGGTQVPEQVINAIAGYLRTSNSNLGGRFETSALTAELVRRARVALAEFIHARKPQEIVFGQNMTSLTFSLSRSLARTWSGDSEIIVTSLDHDANIAPWRLAAAERGVTVKTWEVRKQTCLLDLEDLQPLLSKRTALIAVTLASNACGSHVDIRGVAALAKSVRAIVFVDAVHFAPHGPIDVQSLDCDFLACSAYKFFGPHIGVLWGREELLSQLESFKVRPAPNQPPGKWETGTQSFESIAGTLGALGYLRDLANNMKKPSLADAMELIRNYECTLSQHFLAGVTRIPRISLYGIADPLSVMRRTPTFAVRVEGVPPDLVAQKLGDLGIFVWSGDFYAVDLIKRLGLEESGGVVRVGFVHYNTADEVDRVLEALEGV
jgi:cysteine desulfurase family protein (TIGR01976 family)